LADLVKKNFKDAPVQENECLVDLLYRVKVKGESTLLSKERLAWQALTIAQIKRLDSSFPQSLRDDS
jgi:hypothetical protein